MDELFRPTPPEFSELARFWAETRCQLWLHPDRVHPTDETIIGHATERLAEIAAEVEEEDVAAIIREVEDYHRQAVGDEAWQILKVGTPEQRQALALDWARRKPTQEHASKEDGPVEGVIMHHVTAGAATRGARVRCKSDLGEVVITFLAKGSVDPTLT